MILCYSLACAVRGIIRTYLVVDSFKGVNKVYSSIDELYFEISSLSLETNAMIEAWGTSLAATNLIGEASILGSLKIDH